ncbi:histone H1-beta, late embryonic-like [Penaeus indicus]|uniref:histone H1-beta, late embryonic-like n=1 Tax=Penaeus indicus TaxID=29960 RepID=UPI00300C3EFD
MSSTSTKGPSAKRAHPKYSEMVAAALRALKERNGSSRQAILKFILASFQVGDERAAGVHLKQALRRGVASGSLQQTKGTGASGSFRLSKEELKKAAPRKDENTPGKAVAKKPSAKSTTKKPTSKTAAKKPTSKTATKNPTSKTAAKKPTSKTATKKPTSKTATKKSTSKTATKKPTSKTTTKKPSAKSTPKNGAAKKPTSKSKTKKVPTKNATKKSSIKNGATKKPAAKKTTLMEKILNTKILNLYSPEKENRHRCLFVFALKLSRVCKERPELPSTGVRDLNAGTAPAKKRKENRKGESRTVDSKLFIFATFDHLFISV